MPDLLEDWRRYEKSLLQKLKNRERELLELHDDYMRLEQTLNGYRAFVKMQAARDRRERANMEAKAQNNG